MAITKNGMFSADKGNPAEEKISTSQQFKESIGNVLKEAASNNLSMFAKKTDSTSPISDTQGYEYLSRSERLYEQAKKMAVLSPQNTAIAVAADILAKLCDTMSHALTSSSTPRPS